MSGRKGVLKPHSENVIGRQFEKACKSREQIQGWRSEPLSLECVSSWGHGLAVQLSASTSSALHCHQRGSSVPAYLCIFPIVREASVRIRDQLGAIFVGEIGRRMLGCRKMGKDLI